MFKHIRHVFSEWADWSHPESTREASYDKRKLKELAFPYRRNAEDPQMSKADFDALSDEEAFAICCRDIIEGGSNEGQGSENFDLAQGAYQLEFKNPSGFYSSCKLCNGKSCKGCLVPYQDDLTLEDYLNKLGLSRNDTLFE